MRSKQQIVESACAGRSQIPMDRVIAGNEFDAIHREMCVEFPLYPATVEYTSLVAGTAEYALSESVVRVRQAYWMNSETDYRLLCANDAGYMDMDRLDYRFSSSGEPTEYYIDGQMIGFTPPPKVSSDASTLYPRVKIFAYSHKVLGARDTLPTNLRLDTAYVYAIRYRHAISNQETNAVAMYKQLLDEEMNRISTYFMERAIEVDRSMVTSRVRDKGVSII